MAVEVRLGDWGVLRLLGDGDEVPGELLRGRALWEGDPRRRPVLLTFARGGPVPYVVCWPPGDPPPDPAAPDVAAATATGVHDLRCFACDARYLGLYPDHGVPGFGARTPLVSGCPRCGADGPTSRLVAVALLPR